MWITPKTDWKKSDTFSLAVDYARIRGNMLHLKDLAAKLYPKFELLPMPDFGYADYLYESFFNSIEDGVQLIQQKTFKRKGAAQKRGFTENGTIFSADDLNRMESALCNAYADLQSAEKNRQKLKFKLGGGIFAATI